LKKLKLLIIIFFLTLTVPLGFLVSHTFKSLEQEEIAELHFFANTLFDAMEEEIEELVRIEETRAIADYANPADLSPLSQVTPASYILGYFQHNPDGTVLTPHGDNKAAASESLDHIGKTLTSAISSSDSRPALAMTEALPAVKKRETAEKQAAAPGFADKYLYSRNNSIRGKTLRKEKKSYQKIDQDQSAVFPLKEVMEEEDAEPSSDFEMKSFSAEVFPIQPIAIDDDKIFLFRQVIVHNQLYRQGLVISVSRFLDYLAERFFINQHMARFTFLDLNASHQPISANLKTGIHIPKPKTFIKREFQRPFSFLTATIVCERVPESTGRQILVVMVIVIGSVLLVGLFTLYKSACVIEEHAQRRAGFVSSVTHELKTPLTNIRMYIEMLEQGIARDFEREQRYFNVISSESARLSRLITNVLEFSKLENRKRQLNLQKDNLEDVISEVYRIMKEQLNSQGFSLDCDIVELKDFLFDREAMIQVLINLIENSIKFGRDSKEKQIILKVRPGPGLLKISVSDAGPGIARHALKKIFNDFYRVDNSLTRRTKGTGIGLALVKKLIHAMGGSVSAFNNETRGCTIQLSIPYNRHHQ